MPNRILRDGILTSPRVSKLNWAEEVFYRRLHSIVDDFGRYYADHGLLRAACYPRQLNKVSDSDIEKWLRACADAALVRVYPAEDGERYLDVLDFKQQVRATKSKFPSFDECLHIKCVADAQQGKSNAHLDVSVFGVVDATAAEPPEDLFEDFWKAYPKKKAKDDARKAFDKRKPGRQLLQSMLAAITVQKQSHEWTKDGGQFIPYPASWLNAGCWQDGESIELGQSSLVAGAI